MDRGQSESRMLADVPQAPGCGVVLILAVLVWCVIGLGVWAAC